MFEIRGDGLASDTGHRGRFEVTDSSGNRRADDLEPFGSVQVGLGDPAVGRPETLLRLEITGQM
ncbi:hypothetical protein ABZ816_40145 [Actinosynnema sp. NPDC047251]|uniref:hypothetical protein n=1 Tax=Saccharothrix espanaensis TaxID=103731 RepID=UPI0002DB8BD8|nr:hypothetical protein [Saccharothrix espanaensis]